MPKLKPKIKLNEQLRTLIFNLENCFKKELSRRRPVFSYENIRRRISNALGVGLWTVYRALNGDGQKKNSTEKKKKPKKLDDFGQSLLRRTLHSIYERKEFASLQRLAKRMEEAGYQISKTTVWRYLKQAGFKYYRKNGKRFIKETQEIITQRHSYLRQIRKYRAEGYEAVYLDETWVNSNHVDAGEWTLNRKGPMSVLYPEFPASARYIPSGKGQRLIILDAGSSKTGFIPDVGLVFSSKTNSADYHDEMNSRHFLEWFEHTLIPALSSPSVIVMDNAPYHNTKTQDSWYPKASTTKQDMRNWLVERNVTVDDDEVKAELLQKVKLNTPPQMFETDQIAMKNGHFVLRLPVRHCELNPIELIQGQEKQYVSHNNSTFKKKDVKALFERARDRITAEDWQKAEQHVIRKVENKFWELDGVKSEEVEPVVIQLGGDDSDEDEGEEEEETDGEDEGDGEERYGHNVGPGGDGPLCISQEGGHEEEEEEGEVDEEEDVLCNICNQIDPPGDDDNTDWALCSMCSKWVHIFCCKQKLDHVKIDDYFSCKSCNDILKFKY